MQTTRQEELEDTLADGCSNAREFVKKRLERAERAMSPLELAAEYDCTRSHMASEISDLVDKSTVEKVGRGKYVHQENASEYVTESDHTGPKTQDETSEDVSGDVSKDASEDVPSGGSSDPSNRVNERVDESDQEELEDQDAGDVEEEIGDEEEPESQDADVSTGAASAGTAGILAIPLLLDDDGSINLMGVAIGVVAVVAVWLIFYSSDSGSTSNQQQEPEQQERQQATNYQDIPLLGGT